MKQYIYISMLCGLLLTAVSGCKKASLSTYSATDNIYFNFVLAGLNWPQDSLDFTFAYSPAELKDTLVGIPLAITGPPAEYDRPLDLSIDPTSTAILGTHYELSPLIIRAGRVQDTLFVHLKRTEDLQHTPVMLVMHLEPNQSFQINIPYLLPNAADSADARTFRLNISDILSAWDSGYIKYFGTFSEKKVHLMNEIVGMPLDFWTFSGEGPEVNAHNTASVYYATTMGRYLKEEAANGNTIYEADNITPMSMGAGYQ